MSQSTALGLPLTGKIPCEPRAATGVVIGREVKLLVRDGNVATVTAIWRDTVIVGPDSKLIILNPSVEIGELAFNSRARIPAEKVLFCPNKMCRCRHCHA